MKFWLFADGFRVEVLMVSLDLSGYEVKAVLKSLFFPQPLRKEGEPVLRLEVGFQR